MELTDILILMDRFDSSSASGLELEMAGVSLKLTKAVAAVAAPVPPIPVQASTPAPAVTASAPVIKDTDGFLIKAPLVGTFYQGAAPESPPFATVGTTVRKGQTVCVLEAMKMMSEVPAPADCIIEAVLAQDGELMGFDAPLFRVRLV